MTKTVKSKRRRGSSDAEVDPRFVPVVETFARDRLVRFGKLFASMGLKVNGKIFAMVTKGKLVVKLPKDRVDEIVRSGKGVHFDPGHGRLMKEWVSLNGATPSWVAIAKEAHRFVKSGKA